MRNRVNLFCAIIWATIFTRDLTLNTESPWWIALGGTLAAFYSWQAFKAAYLVDWSQKVANEMIKAKQNEEKKDE